MELYFATAGWGEGRLSVILNNRADDRIALSSAFLIAQSGHSLSFQNSNSTDSITEMALAFRALSKLLYRCFIASLKSSY
jgi:hypothetical protein